MESKALQKTAADVRDMAGYSRWTEGEQKQFDDLLNKLVDSVRNNVKVDEQNMLYNLAEETRREDKLFGSASALIVERCANLVGQYRN